MAKTNDTIDGLLAEFRGYSSGMPPSYHVTMSWADFRKMLDRFDAAHKREMEAVGDAAKLRDDIPAQGMGEQPWHKDGACRGFEAQP